MSGPLSWRLLLGDGTDGVLRPMSGARNMAVDHALLDSARAGGGATLRFYLWSPACLSFGRNQSARGVYDPDRIAELGLDVVRRPTGGRAVLHDRELTYSVAAPVAIIGSPRTAYAVTNRALVDGLRSLGVAAALAPGTGRALRPSGDAAVPCFQDAAPGEVVANGRKLVGSAQRCEHRTILQHGSILLDGDQEVVGRLAGGRAAADAPRTSGGSHFAEMVRGDVAPGPDAAPTTLAALLGHAPAPDRLVRALASAFEATLGVSLDAGRLTAAERAAAAALEGHYGGPEWTWRR